MVAFGTSNPSLNIGFQDTIFFARLPFVSPSGRGERLSRFFFSDQAGRWHRDGYDDPSLFALQRDGMELSTSGEKFSRSGRNYHGHVLAGAVRPNSD